MGLGIIDDTKLAHVPGTVLLDEEAGHTEEQTGNLKHGIGKDSHIILAPQPSEDPNDPLNWSQFSKDFALTVLCFGAVINAATQGPLLSAGTVTIAMEFGTSITAVAQISGYYLLVVGATGPFVSAFATKFGKRPVFVFSSLMGIIGAIVGACASDYHSLLAGRIITGFSTSAYESVLLSALGDLFFVHQRGARISLVNFILAGVSNGVSIIAGPITANLGWNYNFYILIPFVVVQFILLVLFVPETTYRRDHIYDIDTNSALDLNRLGEVEKNARAHELEGSHEVDSTASTEDKTTPAARVPTTASGYRAPPPKKTFLQSMALYTGTYSSDSVFKMVISSIAIMANLGASWVIFISGLLVAWYVAISFVSSQLLFGPPYLFNAAGVGYTSTGPLIGGILGALFCSIVMDPMLKSLTRKNKGIYEPEFRIWLMIPATVFTVAGLVGFGYCAANGVSVYLLSFVWGMMLFGITISAISTSSYALDAFRDNATEIFIMAMVFKNFFFYGLSNFINNWVASSGPETVFNIMGGISGALFLTSIPMYIFGKKYRSFWHRHNLLKILHLETDQAGTIAEA